VTRVRERHLEVIVILVVHGHDDVFSEDIFDGKFRFKIGLPNPVPLLLCVPPLGVMPSHPCVWVKLDFGRLRSGAGCFRGFSAPLGRREYIAHGSGTMDEERCADNVFTPTYIPIQSRRFNVTSIIMYETSRMALHETLDELRSVHRVCPHRRVDMTCSQSKKPVNAQDRTSSMRWRV